jgi:hypothetical protein
MFGMDPAATDAAMLESGPMVLDQESFSADLFPVATPYDDYGLLSDDCSKAADDMVGHGVPLSAPRGTFYDMPPISHEEPCSLLAPGDGDPAAQYDFDGNAACLVDPQLTQLLRHGLETDVIPDILAPSV